jgi:nitrogen fixation protein FixH
VIRRHLHWGTAIAAVYTLFAGSTLAFVVWAINHPVELVSADYYERSLAHDARIAATARADALGRSLEIAVTPEGDALTVAIPREQAAAARGRLTLYRPSDVHADRVVTLAFDGQGRQRIPLAGLARGRWQVRLDWTVAGAAYHREQALTRP